MCGIAGILNLDGSPCGVEEVAPLGKALSHRGPDGHTTQSLGALALAHERLAILDPTSDGDQPMATPDGRFHAVHNGEIYNFLELADDLRAAGWVFRTRTDTEVILAAYALWGPDSVERFNGIWAFAIWDAREGSLFLSRDRLGVKPLFLTERHDRLAFASEIKALLSLPWLDREVNPTAVRDYLLEGLVDHTEQTFFSRIRRLPAGTNLFIARDARRQWRYWHPWPLSDDAGLDPRPGDDARIDEFRERLIESVSLQLRSDVPIGSCLSGGLDSSSIVTIADRLRRGTIPAPGAMHHERDRHPQRAFFAAFDDPGIDERRFVQAVVQDTGVELRTVSPDSRSFLDTLDDVVWHQDEPFGSTSIVAQFHVMRLARTSGVTVVLDGQGADELLGGYGPHAAARYGGVLRTAAGLRLAPALLTGRTPISPLRILWYGLTNGRPPPTRLRPSRHIRSWLKPAVLAAPQSTDPWPAESGSVLSRTLWSVISSRHLPSLLRHEDRNSMAFGIEARVPFLDHRLVELVLSLPDRLKIDDGERKVALRRAMTGFVSPAVLERRDKIGFVAPARWLSESRPVLAQLRTDPRVESAGLLRFGSVAAALAAWDAGQADPDVTWRIIGLELWARVVLRGERHAVREIAQKSTPRAPAPSAA